MKTNLRFMALVLLGMMLSVNYVWGTVKYDAVTWANIANGDTIIIVGARTVSSTTTNYVMVQATPPTVTAVTITNNAITTFTANTEFVAEVVDATIKFRVAGSATNYLVGTNTNNGLKITSSGSNSNVFSIDGSASGGPRMTFTYSSTQRWCGIYDAKDWRCYNSKDATNIKDTKTLFFKKAASTKTAVKYDANGKTLSSTSPALPTDSKEYDKDADITLSTVQLKSELYNFLGWNTDKDATTAISTSTVKATGSDMTFYAIWSDRTLSSIEVSGSPTKTTYEAGESLNPAGLTVTGTYSNETTSPLTEGVEWTLDPETLSAGATTCDVMANVGQITSEVYTVSGLTVNAPVTKYAINLTQPAKATIAANPNPAVADATVTLTYSNVAEHYHFVSWDVTGATPSSTTENNVTFTMPSSEVSVTATVEEDAKYTITFSDGVHGTDCSSFTMANKYAGTQIVFNSIADKIPASPTGDCMADHYHFVGWVESGVEPKENPSNVIAAGTTSINVTKTVTYHAVWAKESNE